MDAVSEDVLAEARAEIRGVEAMWSALDRTRDLTPLMGHTIAGGETDLNVLYGRYFAMIDEYRLSWRR